MKQSRMTRRQFLKAGVLGAGSLAFSAASLTSLVAPPPQEARAAVEQPHKLAIPQPTFNAIASTTAFGPPADLSAGWDGTLWATDASGAPHLYDPSANQWNLHGEGVDAAAYDGQTIYLFRGSQYVTVNQATNQTSAPIDIATTWPKLPDSFKLGVSGAAYYNNTLYLFKGGWYLPTNGAAPIQRLTAFPNWPWQDGLFDAVVMGDMEFGQIYFFRGAEYIEINLNDRYLIGPKPIVGNWDNYIFPAWQTSGFDAGVLTSLGGGIIYSGASASVNAAQPRYIAAAHANWPIRWNPILNHAPSGRVGDLWVSATNGRVMRHDGEHWLETPGVGSSTSVGQDGSVYVIGTDQGLFRWNGTAFQPQGSLAPLTQVAVGDDAHVWVRDGNNAVRRYTGNNNFSSPVNLGAGVSNPTHIAANADGTLWHCNSAVADAQRFISEASAPSAAIPVRQGVVTGVQKVASTGFGAAYCLVTQSGQPQLYRYDSPYLFKTNGDLPVMGNGGNGFLGDVTGGTFAQGLGKLYGTQFVKLESGLNMTVRFLALDAHTGKEVVGRQLPPGNVQYTDLIFDPIHELVYVGAAPWDGLSSQTLQAAAGQLIALDAQTLEVRWTFATAGGIDGAPTLSGTQLCFGDRTNTLYMIETQAALAAAQRHQAVTAEWTWAVPSLEAESHRVSTPVIANGKVYAVAWALGAGNNKDECTHRLAICDATTGLNGTTSDGDTFLTTNGKPLQYQFLTTAPVLGKTRAADRTEVDAIFVNDGFSVMAHSLDATRPPMTAQFSLTDGQITTGFGYDDGSRVLPSGLSAGGLDPANIGLWFGDSLGNLWSLDYQLIPARYSPVNIAQNTRIVTTPLLYKDPQGGLTVLFGVLNEGATLQPALYGFDPQTGNTASVPTGVTGITMFSASVTNGLLYAGGVYQPGDPPGSPKQVFGIRVDALPQALRDFVIESQMMQDPDETAPGGNSNDPNDPIPASRARYQTHLTVVYYDPTQPGTVTPLPHESVKIWADAPATIAVNGARVVIGPGDSDFASVKTGIDGTLVITSGYINQDGSDVPDVYAPVLRVWAGFMNAYERVVVNPDHEFHQRVGTAHANANDDDPDKVNLVTTKSYAGLKGAPPAPLFTTAEQTAGQPRNCANAVAQMKSGVGFGGDNHSPKSLFSRLMLHAGGGKSARRVIRRDQAAFTATAQSPQKYMGYADLTGAGYFPTNIPAARPAQVMTPTGLLLVKPKGQPSTSATFTATDHMTAQAHIDALPPPTVHPPWEPPSITAGQSALGVRRVAGADNIFTDFWNWLKREFEALVIEITDIIISIADEVMVGIRMLVKGVEMVFKAIIRVIDDIATAIGSFFKMLGKIVEDVVAALSVLFHFGEIMATQKTLKSDILAQVAEIKTAITESVRPNVDGFFSTVEGDIVARFKLIRASINGDQISNLQGSGATAHTAFKVAPNSAGPNSRGASHAVQCSWGTQKAKSGLPNATGDASSGSSALFVSSVASFLNRVADNGDLSGAFARLQSDFKKLFHVHSATEFFTTALDVLLDILETLVTSVVVVGGALMDTILGIVVQVIDSFMDLLTADLDIPVLGWLYHALFGQPLTVLNAITLITAIPVTIIYRVARGSYPFAGVTAAQATEQTAENAQRITVANASTDASTNATTIDIIRGLARGVVALMIGLARAGADVLDVKRAPMYAKFLFGATLAYVFLAFTGIVDTNATPLAWVGWGFGLVMALTGATALYDFSDEVKAVLKIVMPLIRMGLGIGRLIVFSFAFADSPNKNAVTNTGFARNLFLCPPPIVNPLKLLPAEAGTVGAIIDGVVDIASGVAVCATDIALVFITADPEPQQRYYFPIVAQNARP